MARTSANDPMPFLTAPVWQLSSTNIRNTSLSSVYGFTLWEAELSTFADYTMTSIKCFIRLHQTHHTADRVSTHAAINPELIKMCLPWSFWSQRRHSLWSKQWCYFCCILASNHRGIGTSPSVSCNPHLRPPVLPQPAWCLCNKPRIRRNNSLSALSLSQLLHLADAESNERWAVWTSGLNINNAHAHELLTKPMSNVIT